MLIFDFVYTHKNVNAGYVWKSELHLFQLHIIFSILFNLLCFPKLLYSHYNSVFFFFLNMLLTSTTFVTEIWESPNISQSYGISYQR
jgi:hypothetical protein